MRSRIFRLRYALSICKRSSCIKQHILLLSISVVLFFLLQGLLNRLGLHDRLPVVMMNDGKVVRWLGYGERNGGQVRWVCGCLGEHGIMYDWCERVCGYIQDRGMISSRFLTIQIVFIMFLCCIGSSRLCIFFCWCGM